MSEDLERKYNVTAMPTPEEVLAGATQGGVAPPAGFFTADDLAVEPTAPGDAAARLRAARAELEAANTALAEAEARATRAVQQLTQAERFFNDAVRREHGL